MNRSGAGKPARPAWPTSARSFEPTAVLGACETLGCGRNARVTCPECRGEHCLRHREHPAHVGDGEAER